MGKFNNWKYRELLKSIAKSGMFHGENIFKKEDLYRIIGKELHMSPETVKYWERDRSNGPDPRIPGLREKLESLLEIEPGELMRRAEKATMEETMAERTTAEKTAKTEEEKNMNKLSDFQKQQIMECYEALHGLVSSMDMEQEDEYYKLRETLERKKLALPETLHKTIMKFLDDVVEPYVFETDYPDFTEEEAELQDGVLNIKTQEAFTKLMSQFLEKLQQLDEKIDQFAERELKPYLLG